MLNSAGAGLGLSWRRNRAERLPIPEERTHGKRPRGPWARGDLHVEGSARGTFPPDEVAKLDSASSGRPEGSPNTQVPLPCCARLANACK
jgi:hypothetical protein